MKIYTRISETSDYKELRITLNIHAPLSKIVAVLDNAEDYINWVYSCSKSHTMKTNKKGDFYYYVKFDLPWPLKDRDMIQHSVQTQDSSTLIINIKTENCLNDLVIEEGVVRIVQSTIKWKLTPISKNITKVDYSVISNPGGDLPSWLVNMVIDLGPKETMQKLIGYSEQITVNPNNIYVIDF